MQYRRCTHWLELLLFLQPLSYSANPLVISSTCLLVLLLVVGVVLARYADTIEQRRLDVIPLCGVDGPFRYEIVVFTGRRPGSGLSSPTERVKNISTFCHSLKFMDFFSVASGFEVID